MRMTFGDWASGGKWDSSRGARPAQRGAGTFRGSRAGPSASLWLMKPSLLAVPLLALAIALAVSTATPARAAAGSKPARKVTAGPRMVLPFSQDDYTRALAEARARKLPLFIEAWAPW
jgi:hypothetical protein